MKVSPLALEGVLLLELKTHTDQRGEFAELFAQERYATQSLPCTFVQDNWSVSGQHVLRGLHLQRKFPQGKLVTVCQGVILDVVADVNPLSPTFGEHIAVELHGFDGGGSVQQLWVPPGYAHGFCVLSEQANVFYKCTQRYHPEDEAGVIWSDGDLNIPWPVLTPVVSERDQKLPTLQQWIEQVQS